jgi:esterase/lipase superfamily enzyme
MSLVFLAVLGLGGWFYYFMYAAPDAVLLRAEAFSHRRMTVAQLGEQGTYRFFYVTNRRPETDDGPIEVRFGTERDESLGFGRFDTKIEPTLGVGMLINPSDWFLNEEIQIKDVRELDQGAFVEQVRGLVQESPYRSLLVVVHGFREAFPSALRKTAFLGHVLDINSPVLVFDWPGDQGSSLRGYRRAQQVARASGADLARTLLLIIRQIQPDRLWLVANSMGAQVVADAFHVLYREADLADAETEIEDVVLTAPDIGHQEFDEQFKREITALARDLTVYVSSNDRALLMSRIVNRGARRRGESTLNIRNPDQFEAAAAVADLTEQDSDRVTLVDVTPVNRTRNFHNFSLETPEFFDDLYLRLVNPETPRSRPEYRVQTPDGKVYWILTRGR